MNTAKAILPDWKWGTAEGSRELDRRLDARLTFREKLEWLEEAETLTLQLRASREEKRKVENRCQKLKAENRKLK
jgi:hypothetical protein